MKKRNILLVMLALLLMAGRVTLQAQNYLPIAEKGNEWHTFETAVWQINNYVNWCSGDTVIEDVRYMKIMGTVNDGYPIFYTLLREEDGKVWKRYSIAHPETLLYDFTASVGDTLRIGNFAEEMVLDSISMVRIGDVDRRKLWFGLGYDNLGRPRAKETLVEGIGSDYGLLWTGYFNVFDGWHCLLCFHQKGELIWENPEYGFCTYTAVEETKDSEIFIYPNPAKGKVTIEGIEIAEIEVFNVLGQLVKAVQGTNEISVAGLPEGVYVLRITDEKGAAYTERVRVMK